MKKEIKNRIKRNKEQRKKKWEEKKSQIEETRRKEEEKQHVFDIFSELHLMNINKNKIYFQLIPSAAFGQKVKTVIGDYQWTKLSKKIRNEANYTCFYCGEVHPEKYGTEAHEIWNWNISTKTQELKNIVCVCKKCHMTVHPGANSYFKNFTWEDIKENYKRINKTNDEETEQDLLAARLYREILNKYNWKLEENLREKIELKYFNTIKF